MTIPINHRSIKKCPKTHWCETITFLFYDSVGQEFEQGMAGSECYLFHNGPRPKVGLEQLEVGGMVHRGLY